MPENDKRKIVAFLNHCKFSIQLIPLQLLS